MATCQLHTSFLMHKRHFIGLLSHFNNLAVHQQDRGVKATVCNKMPANWELAPGRSSQELGHALNILQDWMVLFGNPLTWILIHQSQGQTIDIWICTGVPGRGKHSFKCLNARAIWRSNREAEEGASSSLSLLWMSLKAKGGGTTHFTPTFRCLKHLPFCPPSENNSVNH